MDYKAQRMSLLAYDLYISKQHMLTNMPEEQKRKEQEKYVQRVINRIKDRVLIGQESGCISFSVMPKQLYPFDKMKKDIMLELKKANINVTRVYNIRRIYDKCIVGYQMHWEKLNEN